MEEVKLSEYLILATQFNDNPTEEGEQKIMQLINKIQVKEYLSLKDKEIILVNVVRNISKDYDAPGAAGFLEINKIEKGLFSYCLNLNNDIGMLGNSFLSFDLYFQHGLVDYITSKCEKDYLRLCRMIDNTVQFSNIYRLLESAELLNNTEYDKWIQTMSDIKDTINSENIQELLKAIAVTDDSSLQLLKSIQEEAMREVKEEEKSEAGKFKNALKSFEENKEE